MAKLSTFRSSLGTFNSRRVATPPKVADDIFSTAEYAEWREAVIARGGRRCEAIDNGKRCWKREPGARMFADHIIERRDGGAPFDPMNGQCLCGSHHTAKTAVARAARR